MVLEPLFQGQKDGSKKDRRIVMKQQLNSAKVIGMIPKDNSIFMESLEGKEMTKSFPDKAETQWLKGYNFFGS